MAETKATDLQAIHSRSLQAADKLFEALTDLEAAGGMAALATVLKPKALERTSAVLRSTRAALDSQLKAARVARR